MNVATILHLNYSGQERKKEVNKHTLQFIFLTHRWPRNSHHTCNENVYPSHGHNHVKFERSHSYLGIKWSIENKHSHHSKTHEQENDEARAHEQEKTKQGHTNRKRQSKGTRTGKWQSKGYSHRAGVAAIAIVVGVFASHARWRFRTVGLAPQLSTTHAGGGYWRDRCSATSLKTSGKHSTADIMNAWRMWGPESGPEDFLPAFQT